jgi:membrane associated rhomboid family serine protease
MSILDDLKEQWRHGGWLRRLLLTNVCVFLALLFTHLGLMLYIGNREIADAQMEVSVMPYLTSTFVWPHLIRTPWTVITYMFVHTDFWHLFFNMVMLWFSGRLFQDLLGSRRLLGNYLAGGLVGFAVYALGYGFLPVLSGGAVSGDIRGASAAVMSIFIGIATYKPDMFIHLPLIGEVRLKWIALVYVVLDLVGIRYGSNSGGHLAHLGGALYGFMAARQLKRGSDWSEGLVRGLDRIASIFTFKRRSALRVEHSRRKRVLHDIDYNAAKKEKQQRVDAILDKISRSGYDSLNKDERDFLFKASKDK